MTLEYLHQSLGLLIAPRACNPLSRFKRHRRLSLHRKASPAGRHQHREGNL